jgi:hypothetical protein
VFCGRNEGSPSLPVGHPSSALAISFSELAEAFDSRSLFSSGGEGKGISEDVGVNSTITEAFRRWDIYM